ncbi:MAG: HAMP domain-containing sensor histidine kinase, partial [Sphingomonadales bacterium]
MTGPAWEEAAIARDIKAEKVSLLADRSGVSIISNLAVSIVLAISCSSYVTLTPALSWVGLMGVVVTLRLLQVRNYRNNPNRFASEKWLRQFVISAFVMGMIWALGIVWFGSMVGDTELATIGFIVAGMTSGSAVFGVAHRLMAIAYVVPMLTALLGILLSKSGMSYYLLAITVLLYGAGLSSILKQGEKSFDEACRRSFENEKLANRLSLALAREESAHAAQTQLVANVSHELRTPLGAVIGMIDLARDVSDAESRERFLCIAKESAGALQVMLNDLLEVSKLDLGHLELQMKPMNPASLAKSVGDLFRLRAGDAGLDFEVHVDWPEGHLINADNNRVRQILVNLVGNALKFTSDGVVTLELKADVDEAGVPQCARFIVKDTGIGIPKSEQKRIFERFEQVNGASSRSHQGAGLG